MIAAGILRMSKRRRMLERPTYLEITDIHSGDRSMVEIASMWPRGRTHGDFFTAPGPRQPLVTVVENYSQPAEYTRPEAPKFESLEQFNIWAHGNPDGPGPRPWWRFWK